MCPIGNTWKNAIIVRPFERLVDWRRIAIFLRNDEVADAPAILRNITEEAGGTGMHRAHLIIELYTA